MDDAPAHDLRALPGVDAFLRSPEGAALVDAYGEGLVKLELRRRLAEVRDRIRAGTPTPAGPAALAEALRPRLERATAPAGRKAINATGILLHTGLGRAPLAADAVAALGAAGGYTVLQTSVETGKRCLREATIERYLRALTGCEAATVVNNNAAATMLVLHALAEGREVVVSRGQLIEIGGAFRLPDVMQMSGCILREVGCSNRTHLRDYAAAVGEATGAIIHVHTSNYRVRGFAGTPGIRELAPLAHEHGLTAIDDLGSGALVPLAPWGLANEPLVRDSLAAGADVACFSGDKLIGGPQSGIVVGRREAIERIRTDPFARMFRVGKLTLAALETTLAHYVAGTWREAVPFYRMLDRPVDALAAQADGVAAALRAAGIDATVEEDLAYVGSGSLPDEGIPSRVVTLAPGAPGADERARRLRAGLPPVFARIRGERLCLDMRTTPAEDIDALVARARAAWDVPDRSA